MNDIEFADLCVRTVKEAMQLTEEAIDLLDKFTDRYQRASYEDYEDNELINELIENRYLALIAVSVGTDTDECYIKVMTTIKGLTAVKLKRILTRSK